MKKLFWFLIALASCSSEDTPPDATLDHTKVFETRQHSIKYVDRPFLAEKSALFRTTDVLPSLEVRALAFYDGAIHAATANGLYRFDGTRFVEVYAGEVNDLYVDGARLIAAVSNGLLVYQGAAGSDVAMGRRVLAAAGFSRGMFAVTSSAVVGVDVAGLGGPVFAQRPVVRDLLVAGDTLFAATDRGVWRFDLDTMQEAPALRAPDFLADDDVRAIALSEDGTALLAGTGRGLARIPLDGGAATITEAGPGALPAGGITAVTAGGGLVFTGHSIGATVISSSGVEHYHSRRWIPAQQVTAVALGANGSRWIGTSGGIGRISYEETTLAAKAELFEEFLENRHWRMDGFVDDDVGLGDPWNPDADFRKWDKDNDGLWTQMQIGPWCLAYAATGEERYYRQARRAMDVMLLQVDIPAITFQAAGKKPGFITRSLVRDDEGAVFEDKKTRANWHLQEYQGHEYYWKDDTSSDEYAGHFFGYPLFYDLCAKTEEEKEAIRSRMRLVMDYVIDGGYLLLDLDGEKTTHGHWKDLAIAADDLETCTAKHDFLACAESWGGGGWLNSLEILGHLLATWHMTGDQKYYDEYERLYTVERYGEMIPIRETYFTITEPAIANHSDHELAMLAYFTLLRYEPNADRRAVLVKSVQDLMDHEKEERNPWHISTGGSAIDVVALDDAIRTLKEMPTDWRTWRVDNDHRQDAGRWPADRHGDPQFKAVFPYDEIRTMKWNGNPYAVAGGGEGNSILAPTPYLIAYWKLRYFGLLE